MYNLISKVGRTRAKKLREAILNEIGNGRSFRLHQTIIAFEYLFVNVGGNMILAWSEKHDRASVSMDGVKIFSVEEGITTFH